jgi:hypothetical protein
LWEVGTLDCDDRCAADRRRQQLAEAFDKNKNALPSFLQCEVIDWPVELVVVHMLDLA